MLNFREVFETMFPYGVFTMLLAWILIFVAISGISSYINLND